MPPRDLRMTAVPVSGAADSSWWRVGRAAARVLVVVCAVVFVTGVVLWARGGQSVVVLWAMPGSWSEEGLREAAGGLGLPSSAVYTYFVLLEFLPAAAGLLAAVLVLRGATGWFRFYVAVVLALFGTVNGAIPGVYEAVAGGVLGDALVVLQGVAWVSLFPLAYVFPDGRFVPRWTRWCAIAWVSYLPYSVLLVLLGVGGPESLAETLPVLVLWATAAFAAGHRYRRAAPEERRQLRGVVAALVLWFVFNLVLMVSPLHTLVEDVSARGLVAGAVTRLLSYGIVALIPAAVAVAILRYRLYDVDVWVNRALVYGLLTGVVVLGYALLAALGGLIWQSNNLAGPLVAVIVIAIVLHPLRARVQRWVDRFVYGRRKEPYAVLADLGRQLETVLPPDQILATVVRQVGNALKLPYVAARHGSASVVHPVGAVRPAGHEEVFPLRWQDEDLGTLTVVATPGDELSAADRDLLDGLARQAGAAVRAASLNDDLRRSRKRILIAREDERKRLQRDLHDGLGPTLASLYQRVDAARSLLDRDPAAAARLLEDVGVQTKSVIGDIRDVVRALRPPELDELGLADAIEAAAGRFDGMAVTVVSDVPPLPPVGEIAAYRIATEALTNVARHADAEAATVRLSVEGRALVVSVTDNGQGLPDSVRTGTGLRSMRERADELGGTFDVTSLPSGGTQVRAVLPLGAAS